MKYKVWEPLLLAIMVIIGMVAGQKMGSSDTKPGYLARIDHDQSLAGDRIEELIKFVETRYVDDVDAEALVEKAINSVLAELDPHSNYLGPDEVADLDAKMQGSFEGIGIEFDQFDDTLVIIHVIPDGPAMEAGLKPGDRLLMANDSSLIGAMSHQRALLNQLKGPKGSKVRLGILRGKESEIREFEVRRDVIPIHSVPAAFMIDGENGYIKIDRFSSTTYKEFMDALEGLVEGKGMKNLIIDVRQNPGGYLQEAVNILSQLFDERSKLIVYTQGEHSKRTEYKTTGNPFFPIDRVTVLIDEGSASASEIMAGAVQDHDRGIIIGTKSFGKGLVQEQYKLSNGGALRLTVARYYTPSGRLIQRPYDAARDTNYLAYYVGQDSIRDIDSTEFYTQNGRVVYGEGGIEPDILQNSLLDWRDPETSHLYKAMTRFALLFIDPDLKASDEEAIQRFRDKLPRADSLFKGFKAYLGQRPANEQIDLDRFGLSVGIGDLVIANIMSIQFGHTQWYREISHFDPVMTKAAEVLSSDQLYSEQLH